MGINIKKIDQDIQGCMWRAEAGSTYLIVDVNVSLLLPPGRQTARTHNNRGAVGRDIINRKVAVVAAAVRWGAGQV